MSFLFFFNIKSESLKVRRTAALGLTLMAAAFIPAINAMICIQRPDAMIPKFTPDPWTFFLRFNWKNTATVILPLFVILVTNLVLQIEFRNGTWKQVYATPRKYADIYYSKFIVIHLFVICFLVLFNIFLLASGATIQALQPGYKLLFSTAPWTAIFIQTIRIYIGILGVCAIQYWLSSKFGNFIVPLGVGMGLWLAGLVLMDWDKIIYYPYMYSTLFFFTDFTKHPSDLPRLIICSFTAFAVAITVGFLNIYHLRERG